MDERRRPTTHTHSCPVLLLLVLALVSIGCMPRPTLPTEPPTVGDPLPGSFHLTSIPPRAPRPLTIRADDIGGPSGRSAQFEAGDEVVLGVQPDAYAGGDPSATTCSLIGRRLRDGLDG